MVYCIDTHTFCWCIKHQVDAHDEQYRQHAINFMRWVDESRHQLIIPTVVLAEALIREPIENHPGIIEAAYRTFMVADFDSRAASKYGELLRLDNWQKAKDAAKQNSIRREKMKLDHMIISCALVHGANGIISEDEDVIIFSKGLLPVHSIKSFLRQGEIIIQDAAKSEAEKVG